MSRITDRLHAVDRAVFDQVAARSWPGAEPVLPRLSRSANRGMLWFGVAAGLAVFGGARGRRAALRGLGSLAAASLTVNTVGKRTVRRRRPLLVGVPPSRHLHRQPFTTSFPSGHSASAAAFAAGVALESRRLGTLVAPAAWSVAFSRIYTGVHYPGDVLAGLALGVGAALAVRGLVPSRDGTAVPARPRADAPALPGGEGLIAVLNPLSGPPPLITDPAHRLRTALPRAEVVVHDEDDDLVEVLEDAARRAAERGGALGVHGGDGSVNAAAAAALRHGVPLAVFSGGTRNHFAADLGLETVEDTARAVQAGDAVAVDLARWSPGALPPPAPGRGAPAGGAAAAAATGGGTTSGAPGGTGASGGTVFVNTFSIGSYPELVRVRERWSRRVGSLPAGVLAAVHVLRHERPVEIRMNGVRRTVWLVFVGNSAYRTVGFAPARRGDLADGLLDVRVVHGGRFARTRLVAAALTGALGHSPVYSAALLRRVRIGGLAPGTRLAFDGEVVPAPGELVVDKLPASLVVYRPVARR
ncbi:phosphatase PAP2 family protein [Streptomyces sp. SCUT-3]|uniref:bifunctional phosphatase PAP2/diacylglycerol kinase family protein n=1 Tax=Streptomyces sp. SCUT-3 TaxID=2684469 RepID=UPI0015FB4DBD|nr:bifunctional phosphatase PAP2/diacylglycerol kinase family protein [Streptomyces sp. SCUT-3]QMV21206.1 phosphatase PAP2 family protein [Streptomyces sp. SCUT-3]